MIILEVCAADTLNKKKTLYIKLFPYCLILMFFTDYDEMRKENQIADYWMHILMCLKRKKWKENNTEEIAI